MRFISVPMVILDSFKAIVESKIQISPFSIEAYYDDELEYIGPGGQTSTNITTLYMKSGRAIEILMDIKEFEQELEHFYNQ